MLGEKIGSTHEAARSMAQSLQQTSTESLRRLNEIVWAVNPERDYLPHLADYLQRFAGNYLANSDIRLRVEIPDDIPPLHLSSKSRLTLYLATREAFRNAVRHGRPSLITLQISIAAGTLMIAIADNGCGFDPATTDSSGNGLVNMRARLKEIGGTCTIDSAPGAGTKVTFSLPLLKPNRP
jgi:signal transduction histidine kinase